MRWVTRAHCHIDRTASAWLIRRFVDPEATFEFVEDPGDLPEGATPFDIAGAEYGHHGDRCTFETILDRHGLTDPALARLGEIVHEADVEDERYDAPEAPGLNLVIRGLGRVLPDPELLVVTDQVFDAVYAELRSTR
jgi:hypothetical protein